MFCAITAFRLRYAKRQLAPWIRPAVCLCLTALLFLQLAMAASEPLHKFFHADADSPGHECAVTLFVHGHVDASSVAAPVVAPVTGVEITPRLVVARFQANPRNLPPGRGPPVLCPAS